MKIYLIGMPGSGKTTVGKLLAEKLNYKFIDLDSEIEKNALLFIDDIFESYGEKKFRELETEELKKINDNNLVISCGGGIVVRNENKALMNGLKIYLNTDLNELEKRLENDYPRPIFKKKTLETIYDERFLKYLSFADVNIDNNKDFKETVNNILNYLKEEKLI